MILIHEQIHGILDPASDCHNVKWLSDEIRNPHFKTLYLNIPSRFRTYDYYRYPVKQSVFSHVIKHRVSIDIRHDQIKEHRCYPFTLRLQYVYGLHTISSLDHFILITKCNCKYPSIQLNVIDYQYFFSHLINSST